MRDKRGGSIQDEGKREEEGYRIREKREGRIKDEGKRGGRIEDEGKEGRKDTG
jgi:hypothetical protein